MPTNFEQLIFEIIATDRNASAAFDRFRAKVDQTSRSVDTSTSSLDKNTKSLENLGKEAGTTTPLLGSLSGASGMAGLVAAGVALAPVLVTVGVGLGGLGLAALAAGKNSKELKAELVPLRDQFKAFGDAVEPTLVTDFAAAAKLAGQVLASIQPVTVATGKAMAVFLGQLGHNFQGQEWQQFFRFMATTATPDVQMLGQTFIDLANSLPPLLQALQPVATDLISIADAATKVIHSSANVASSADQQAQHENFLAKTTDMLRTVLFAPGVGLYHALQLVGIIHGQAAGAAYKQAAAMATLDQRVTHTRASTADLIRPLGTATAGLTSAAAAADAAWHKASLADSAVDGLAVAIHHLNTELANSVKPNSTFNTDLINTANAAVQAQGALKKTHDQIGLNTAAQRTAFSYQQTYIDNLVTLATDAGKSRQKQDEATQAIRNALPQLRNVSGGTRQYWQEVQTLVNWLHREQQFQKLRTLITVNGQGVWHIAPGGGLPGGTAGGPFAAGGLVRAGTTGTADDVVARVSKGELIVPANLVAAGLADHLRGMIPGFAGGGIVPGYSGNVGGLAAWTQGNFAASVRAVTVGIAQAMASAFKTAFGFGMAGPGGGAPAANAALARRMYPAWGSGAEWAAWNYVAMRESGWNQFARNPTSGAYGIPQALPPGKMGPAANPPASNPAAQISWMIGYIRSVYGDPIGAAAHERAFNWYDHGGYLPVGLSLALNTTGRPERVGGGDTYNVYVQVGHGTNPRQAAQEIVKILNQGATAGVKLRTSILGPG